MMTTLSYNPFKSSVAFRIETIHLICRANQMTGFYMKCNIGPKRANRLMKYRKSKQTLMIQSIICTCEFQKYISLVVGLFVSSCLSEILIFFVSIWLQHTVERNFFFPKNLYEINENMNYLG